MKPLNQKERAETTLKFSLVFILLLIVSFTIMYLNFYNPYRLSKSQYSQLETLNEFKKFEKELVAQMAEARVKIFDISTSTRDIGILRNDALESINFSRKFSDINKNSTEIDLLLSLDSAFTSYLELGLNFRKNAETLKGLREDLSKYYIDKSECEERVSRAKNDCPPCD